MYCIQCGTELASEAKFCHACGSAAFSASRLVSLDTQKAEKTTPPPSVAPKQSSKWSGWSLKVSTEEQALKAIRESAMGFYVVAGMQALMVLILGAFALIDASLFAGLGFWLHMRSSRTAATLLAILSAVSIGTTVWNQVTGDLGGRNVVLSVIVFWAAVRAVIATYKLRSLTNTERPFGRRPSIELEATSPRSTEKQLEVGARSLSKTDPTFIVCSRCAFEQWNGYKACQKCGAAFQ